MTVSAHNAWAWGGANDGVKSVATCLGMLVRGAGGDGNILLNVGPRPDGVIDPAQVNVLKQIGEWLAKNGEAIYGTRGGPFKPADYGASTRKGQTIYVQVFKWPETGALKLPNVSAKLVNARLLSGGKVDAKQSDVGLEISVAKSDRQKAVTVVALEFDSDVMNFSDVSVAPAVKSEVK
jgi:alpha-L-fucosidase